MSNGYESTGLIERIGMACKDITLDMEELTGRSVSYEDGTDLINALFYAKADIEEAIAHLEHVLNDEAVCQ